MTRARTAAAITLLAVALAAGGAQAAPPTPQYAITTDGLNGLLIQPSPGVTSLALVGTFAGGTLTLTPAAATLAGGCTNPGGGVTTCPASAFSTKLTIKAASLDVRIDGAPTGTLTLEGGVASDRLHATNVPSGTVVIRSEDSGDDVRVSGAPSSLSIAEDDGGDNFFDIAVPGLSGTLNLRDADDTVVAPATNLTVLGGGGNDVLQSGGTMNGGAGDDLLRPANRTQTVVGGPGNDRVTYAGSATPVTIAQTSEAAATIDGGLITITEVEEYEGGDAADTLTGSGSADVLLGGPGDDMLTGGGGADLLDGGSGIDTLRYDDHAAGDPVAVDLGLGGGWPIARPGERDTFTGFEKLITTAGNDVVTGSAGPDDIAAGGGHDTITGAGGDDVIDAGGGPATVNAGPGADTVRTDLVAPFDDMVFGGSGNDDIRTGPGNDTIESGLGADTVDGGPGVDITSYADRWFAVTVALDANADDGQPGENDRHIGIEGIRGGTAADQLVGDAGPNFIDGGAGKDLISGGDGADVLHGGPDRDIVSGDGGPDMLFGDDGNDSIKAFDGQPDTVDCGPGVDDDAEHDAADQIVGCEFTRDPSQSVANDRDGDGVIAGTDCDDTNAAIRPGATDVPGNGIDEDCSGSDAPLPEIGAEIKRRFTLARRGTAIRIGRLTLTGLPKGARVKVTCKAYLRFRRRCAFSKRITRLRGNRTALATVKWFKNRALPVGTRIEFTMSAPGYVTQVNTLVVRKLAAPKETLRCIPPGQRAKKRCTEISL